MPRSDSDAVAQRPTLEQEVAKFKGFSTTDGEVSDGKPTNEEAARIAADAARAEQDAADAAANQQHRAKLPGETENEVTEGAASPENETTEEKTAREAAEAAAAVKKPNKLTAEQRINQAVARQRQAERLLDSERAKHAADMASLSARTQALETGTSRNGAASTADTSGRPDPSKFEFGELDGRYQEALVEWKVDQKLKATQQSQQQQTQTVEQERARREWTERLATVTTAGREKYPDFDETVMESAYNAQTNPGGWLLSSTMGNLILRSPVGQDVAYALASDPKEAARVFRLDPMDQAAYFGRIEATFSPPAGAKSGSTQTADGQQRAGQVQTPKAAPPPQVRGRGTGAKTTVPGDTSDFAAFERAAMGRAK